jgi:hypothetical protein
MENPSPVHPFSGLLDGTGRLSPDGRQALQDAEVILAVNRGTQEETRLFGAAGGLRVLRVEVDPASDELPRLAGLVQAVKGGLDLPPGTSEPNAPVLAGYVGGGPIEVRTTDVEAYFAQLRAQAEAELELALAEFRRQGYAHPVLFSLSAGNTPAHHLLFKELADARQVFASQQDGQHRLTTVERARALLRSVVGKSAARLFRVPSWPVSYWVVRLDRSGRIETGEGRTTRDVASERPAAGPSPSR